VSQDTRHCLTVTNYSRTARTYYIWQISQCCMATTYTVHTLLLDYSVPGHSQPDWGGVKRHASMYASSVICCSMSVFASAANVHHRAVTSVLMVDDESSSSNESVGRRLWSHPLAAAAAAAVAVTDCSLAAPWTSHLHLELWTSSGWSLSRLYSHWTMDGWMVRWTTDAAGIISVLTPLSLHITDTVAIMRSKLKFDPPTPTGRLQC